jgi:hypothetical protein
LQFEKHDEQKISAFRGIVIDLISRRSKDQDPMSVTRSLEAREGKKTDDETMTTFFDANPTTVADPADVQTLTRAMTTEASDIETSN